MNSYSPLIFSSNIRKASVIVPAVNLGNMWFIHRVLRPRSINHISSRGLKITYTHSHIHTHTSVWFPLFLSYELLIPTFSISYPAGCYDSPTKVYSGIISSMKFLYDKIHYIFSQENKKHFEYVKSPLSKPYYPRSSPGPTSYPGCYGSGNTLPFAHAHDCARWLAFPILLAGGLTLFTIMMLLFWYSH